MCYTQQNDINIWIIKSIELQFYCSRFFIINIKIFNFWNRKFKGLKNQEYR